MERLHSPILRWTISTHQGMIPVAIKCNATGSVTRATLFAHVAELKILPDRPSSLVIVQIDNQDSPPLLCLLVSYLLLLRVQILSIHDVTALSIALLDNRVST